jgi:hypothetical protein
LLIAVKKEYQNDFGIPSFFALRYAPFHKTFCIFVGLLSSLTYSVIPFIDRTLNISKTHFFKTCKLKIMSYEAEGKLYKKMDTQQVTDSFKKREFVVEIEDGAYSQIIKFQLVQGNCDKLDPFNEGDQVKVTFSLRGREYTKEGKTSYFTNLDAWRLEAAAGAVTPPPSSPAATTAAAGTFPPATDAPAATDDDLPF